MKFTTCLKTQVQWLKLLTVFTKSCWVRDLETIRGKSGDTFALSPSLQAPQTAELGNHTERERERSTGTKCSLCTMTSPTCNFNTLLIIIKKTFTAITLAGWHEQSCPSFLDCPRSLHRSSCRYTSVFRTVKTIITNIRFLNEQSSHSQWPQNILKSLESTPQSRQTETIMADHGATAIPKKNTGQRTTMILSPNVFHSSPWSR